ncbi:MAG: hypothetical protein GX671_08085 [Clostridiales bacterium]|nr:hypothetical protein [Clostridiales bacterium]
MNVEIKEPCAGCRHCKYISVTVDDKKLKFNCGLEDICRWIAKWDEAEKDGQEKIDGLEGVYAMKPEKEPDDHEEEPCLTKAEIFKAMGLTSEGEPINPCAEKQVSELSDQSDPEEIKAEKKVEKHVKKKGGTLPHKILKTCRTCGRKFEGGPNSKYCPECKPFKPKKVTVIPPPAAPEYTEKAETIKDCKHKDCEYRRSGNDRMNPTCDYLIMTGQPRGCDLSVCDKYRSKYK